MLVKYHQYTTKYTSRVVWTFLFLMAILAEETTKKEGFFKKLRGGIHMYYISVAVTVLILYVFTIASIGAERIRYFIDLSSLCLLILVCIPVLVSSGLQKDFFRAFSIAGTNSGKTTLREKKRSREAVALVMKSLLATGIFSAVYSMVMVFAEEGVRGGFSGDLCVMLSVSLICLLYALTINLLLLPLYEKLKLMVLEHTQD